MGLNAECNKEEKHLAVREQGGGQQLENHYAETCGAREDSCGRQARAIRHPWGLAEDEEPDQIRRVGVLAKLTWQDSCKMG